MQVSFAEDSNWGLKGGEAQVAVWRATLFAQLDPPLWKVLGLV